MLSDAPGRHTLVHSGSPDSALQARQIAELELAPGEELFWADRTVPGWGRPTLWASVLSTVAAAIASSICIGAAILGQMSADLGIYAPMAAIITGTIAAVLYARYQKYNNCLYAITDCRIFKIKLSRGKRVTSYRLAQVMQPHLPDGIQRSERPDGVGTLTVPGLVLSRMLPDSAYPLIISGVPNVRLAEQALRQVLGSGNRVRIAQRCIPNQGRFDVGQSALQPVE